MRFDPAGEGFRFGPLRDKLLLRLDDTKEVPPGGLREVLLDVRQESIIEVLPDWEREALLERELRRWVELLDLWLGRASRERWPLRPFLPLLPLLLV